MHVFIKLEICEAMCLAGVCAIDRRRCHHSFTYTHSAALVGLHSETKARFTPAVFTARVGEKHSRVLPWYIVFCQFQKRFNRSGHLILLS